MVLQTLDIVAENPEKFKVVALAAGSNITLLADQVFIYDVIFCGTSCFLSARSKHILDMKPPSNNFTVMILIIDSKRDTYIIYPT